jgi:hypothetical protein
MADKGYTDPAPTPSSQQVTWRVTSQVETSRPDASGRIIRGVQVGWEASTGATGSVFVPEAAYNAAVVAQAVQQAVRNAVVVGQLTGTV